MCERDGMVKAASVVDHIKPHKGDPELFWNEANWMALCSHHHNSEKQRIERGRIQAIGADGWPV
jgi:5-methylcytosine-specific restriction protein A